jgi:poly-beta-1,6-N-acetyl-D-glucosamine synthase
MRIGCSIGIFAHNEEANILHLLRSVCEQKLQDVAIEEIIVVSSGSSDRTDDLVRGFALEHPQVRLYTQPRREGKSNAINLFMAEARSGILVVISGDVIPAKDAIELLVSEFSLPEIGATGGRPMPVNAEQGFIGYAVQLLWRLHHRMALISPKLGELIAFRKVMDVIPADSAVDEASIEAIIRQKGLKLKYVPSALIANKGPENVSDYIKQRRRIQTGHLWLKKKQQYQVVSQDGSALKRVLLQELKEQPQDLFKLILVVALEAYCRFLGSWDFYVRGKNPFVWEISRSTKAVKS